MPDRKGGPWSDVIIISWRRGQREQGQWGGEKWETERERGGVERDRGRFVRGLWGKESEREREIDESDREGMGEAWIREVRKGEIVRIYIVG